MPVLSLENASLAFGHVPLLDRANLQVEAGDRVALIGRNGCGKSSLLRCLAGASALDDGRVWRANNLAVAYVEQESAFAGEQTVFDCVSGALGHVGELVGRYHSAAAAVAQGGGTGLEELETLQHEVDAADGWRLNSRVEQAVARVQLDPEARVGSLSGGGLKRLALARAFVQEPDVLLLDEPTNHLDLDGIRWLEEEILAFRGAVVVVTHDRAFLDRVATRIVELDRGYLSDYPGSFSLYQQRKAAALEAEALENARFDKFLAQEEVWIRKGVEARRTRNQGRVLRLEQLRRDRAARRERVGQVRLALDRGEASGQMVAELEGVGKRYGERWLVKDFSCRILRGDRVGLIGPNGAGKTTLLKLILGQLPPDAGTVRQGSRVSVAYFDQFRTQLDEEAPLTEVISPGSDYVESGGQRKHVIGYLEDFLFPPARSRSPVKALSGGERNRLLLARLFARPANVLVLDEPTNDLDIETLELLESLLQDYDGTVFLVSHDRRFLDSVVTQVIASEGDGRWKEYAGGYEDWVRQRGPAPTPAPAKPAATPEVAGGAKPKPARNVKLSFNEKRELEALPDQITQLEAEQAQVNARLADPATYRDAAQEVPALRARLEALDEEILAAMERWEALEAKAGAGG